MSDLQADIDLVLQLNSPVKAIREATERVVAAARRVANPDMEAATATLTNVVFGDDNRTDRMPNAARRIVAAALGITEDPK